MVKNTKVNNDYVFRYSLTSPYLCMSFNTIKYLKDFMNKEFGYIASGKIYDHKYHRDYATILNNIIYIKGRKSL